MEEWWKIRPERKTTWWLEEGGEEKLKSKFTSSEEPESLYLSNYFIASIHYLGFSEYEIKIYMVLKLEDDCNNIVNRIPK